ncbi:hypothetical protein [Streptomyces fulvoviolaceus]|uniref:hypothetical protein n=1 Tax=Streptomyces fulvoviolaceus TaxID=285535 RepID=UPI00131B1EFA|nr:hypothetical protein [Streptomyces fulvoviolaceus]MCT9075159.1 hypothetical protein [Streptomyces fulvoviolaceus]
MPSRRFLPCVVLAACLTGCGGPATGVRVEGPAATAIPWAGPAYVSDQYGRAWQRPTTIELTELVFLDRLTWRDWGAPRTVATGEASCGTSCSDWRPRSYRVRVVLSGRVRRASVAYYGEVTVTPVHPPAPGWATGFDSAQSLNLPDT